MKTDWQITDWQHLVTLNGHRYGVTSVAFSPDSETLASCGHDHAVRLWDRATWACRATLLAHTDSVFDVTFSPDGTLLASASADCTVRLWHIGIDYHLVTSLHGHTQRVMTVVFHPDGRIVASGGSDQTIRLWNTATGDLIDVVQQDGWVCSLAFNATRQLVASAGADHVLVWDSNTWQHRTMLHGQPVNGNAMSIAFSRDGHLLAVRTTATTMQLWDCVTWTCVKTLPLPDEGGSFCFSHDGRMLFSQAGVTLQVWDVRTGMCLRNIRGYNQGVMATAFHPNGNMLAVGGHDAAIHLWDLQSGHYTQRLQGHTNWVTALAFSADGRMLASGGSHDHTVRLWDIDTGWCTAIFAGHPRWWISEVTVSADGSWLVVGSGDGMLRIWSLTTDQPVQILHVVDEPLDSVVISPDGRTLAVMCRDPQDDWHDRIIQVWDRRTGQRLRSFPEYRVAATTPLFSPDGTYLLGVTSDHEVRVWRVQSGAWVHTLRGHTDAIRALAWSVDGRLLYSASTDQTIRSWDMLHEVHRTTVPFTSSACTALTFSADARLLAGGTKYGQIRLWDVQTGQCLMVRQIPRPYEGMNITGATGLTDAQRDTLKALGAIEYEQYV